VAIILYILLVSALCEGSRLHARSPIGLNSKGLFERTKVQDFSILGKAFHLRIKKGIRLLNCLNPHIFFSHRFTDLKNKTTF
jgi:hypothetical protein